MGTLPSGNVTFCFTDIEGSTQLFAKLGPRFLDLLEDHRRIIRAAVAEYGGAEVKTEGDGFFLAFGDATAAVNACVAFQRRLAKHPWPDGHPVKVRAGLHIGEAKPQENDYMVFAVHEAARIGAAAHGGQTIVSDVLKRALDGSAVDGITLKDLGEHELKDLGPLRLHQVVHPELADIFPALRSAGGSRGYVPSPTSSFIGRTDDVASVSEQLSRSRLVTITGSGGVGKTRIAIEAARSALGTRSDGVWFIDLAPITDGSRIDDVLLAGLGVQRDTAVAARDQALAWLADRDALIVLDNCEHVIDDASALVAAILSAAPRVGVLATSRESLGIDGELAWRLTSLDDPTSTMLFIERARLVRPDFDVDDASRDAVDRILERLDGIPLAIELAAARIRVLTPAQIAERLDDRFRLLTGGSRTSLARQRTLEATVDWSYQLLDEAERSLLCHLSVFVGSFDLTAADAVWGGDALDELERLVDKSMVQVQLAGDGLRYRLLETIRHFAWMKLLETDDVVVARDRHMRHYEGMITQALGFLDGRENHVADVMQRDEDNIRAAVVWATDGGHQESALVLGAHLWIYAAICGRSAEGLALVRRVIDVIDDERADPELRAQLYLGAAHLAFICQEHMQDISAYADVVVAHARDRAPSERHRWYDAWGLIVQASALGAVFRDMSVDLREAERWSEEAGAPFVRCEARLSIMQLLEASPQDMVAYAEQSVEIGRSTGGASIMAYTQQNLASVLIAIGDVERAVDVAAEAVAGGRRGPNLWFLIFALQQYGRAKALRGDDDASHWLAEAVALGRNAGIEYPVAYAEVELGRIAMREKRLDDARDRFAAAGAILNRLAAHRPEMLFFLALTNLLTAEVDQLEGRLDAARETFETTLLLAKASGISWVVSMVENSLGWLEQQAGDLDAAEAHHRAALEDLDDRVMATVLRIRAESIRGLAGVALARGDATGAARLLGAASYLRGRRNNSSELIWIRSAETTEGARDALGSEAFDAAWAVGEAAGDAVVSD